MPLADGARIALGFDGSTSQDATALVSCDEDGHLRLEDLWERDDRADHWQVPRGEVHALVASLFIRYKVARMLADPWQWRDEIDNWAAQHGEEVVRDYPTNSVRRFAAAIDRFRSALATGSLSHDGDARLDRPREREARTDARCGG